MGRRERAQSVLAVLLQHGGPVEGYKAGLYLMKWLIACDRAGRLLTVEEYYAWWKVSESSAYRERRALAASLPAGMTVEGVQTALWANQEARKLARKEKGAVIAGLADLPFPLAS